MKTETFIDFRSMHKILTEPMTLNELKSDVTKSGKISVKLLFDFNSIIANNLNWLCNEANKRITGSSNLLSEINFKIAGRTTKNEVIVKVDAILEFDNI